MGTLRILVVLAALLLLVGCGYTPYDGDEPRTTVVKYRGGDLHCIHFKGSSHGEWSGVVCDFQRFYEENQ